MGVEYFLKIPELKILWHIGRNIGINVHSTSLFEENLKRFKECYREIDVEELQSKNLSDINVHDISGLYRLLENSWIFAEDSFEFEYIAYLLRKKGICYEVVSDIDIDKSELKKQGWKVIAWWTKE